MHVNFPTRTSLTNDTEATPLDKLCTSHSESSTVSCIKDGQNGKGLQETCFGSNHLFVVFKFCSWSNNLDLLMAAFPVRFRPWGQSAQHMVVFTGAGRAGGMGHVSSDPPGSDTAAWGFCQARIFCEQWTATFFLSGLNKIQLSKAMQQWSAMPGGTTEMILDTQKLTSQKCRDYLWAPLAQASAHQRVCQITEDACQQNVSTLAHTRTRESNEECSCECVQYLFRSAISLSTSDILRHGSVIPSARATNPLLFQVSRPSEALFVKVPKS